MLQSTLNKIAVVDPHVKNTVETTTLNNHLVTTTAPEETPPRAEGKIPYGSHCVPWQAHARNVHCIIAISKGFGVLWHGNTAASTRGGRTTVKTYSCVTLGLRVLLLANRQIDRAGIGPTSNRCHQAGRTLKTFTISNCIPSVQSILIIIWTETHRREVLCI